MRMNGMWWITRQVRQFCEQINSNFYKKGGVTDRFLQKVKYQKNMMSKP